MRYFVSITLFVILLLACVSGSKAEATRNVLLLLCSDLSQRIGPYTDQYPNESVALTPAMDHLAADSIVFDSAYCQQPAEGQSRLSMLSGLYPECSGITAWEDVSEGGYHNAPSMARHLKENRYWTASAGRVYPNAAHDGDKLNWDAVVRLPDFELPMVKAARKAFIAEHSNFFEPGSRVLWRKTLAKLAPQTSGQVPPGYGPSGLDDRGHADGRNASCAADWINNRAWGDRPFFIAVGFEKPHVPFVVPQRYFELYDPNSLLFAAEVPRTVDEATADSATMTYKRFGFRSDGDDVVLRRKYLQAYFSSVSFVDAQIGLVLDAIESANVADDTLIILAADNGYLLGRYRLWGKDMLYDGCTRVPLIVSAPGWSNGPGRTSKICELVDLFPTVCDWCGIDPPDVVQGRSLASVIKDPHSKHKSSAYSIVRRGGHLARSIRTAHWRYTEWDGPDVTELLDVTGQPNRTHDPELESVKATLRTLLAVAANEASSDH